jgi:F-type H+-transporting ATPase subunit delta
MKPTLLANRYARAFVRVSLRKGEAQAWYSQLKNFTELLAKTPLLASSLSNPGIPFAKKRAVVEKLTDQTVLRNFLLHLAQRNRLRLLPEIICRGQQLLDNEAGVARASVRTASPMSAEEKLRLSESLKDFFQKPILVEDFVDPELLAGMMIRVGDTILDGSLKGQLKLLEHQLINK